MVFRIISCLENCPKILSKSDILWKSVLVAVAFVRFYSIFESLVGSIRTRVSCFLLQFYYAGTAWYLISVCLIACRSLPPNYVAV